MPARRTSRPQVRWTVLAKADCQRVVELLYAHPLRGRKAGDFAIWAAAVNWWVGADATHRRPSGHWGPMPYLKARLSAGKANGDAHYNCGDRGDSILSSDWADYFAGLVTAEGHLGLHKVRPDAWAPRMSIRMRADDAPLLQELRKRTQAGKVYGPYAAEEQNPALNWVVMGSDLRGIVALLDEHPPRGRKHAEYGLWRRAVDIYTGTGPRKAIHARLSSLQEALKAVRKYPNRS